MFSQSTQAGLLLYSRLITTFPNPRPRPIRAGEVVLVFVRLSPRSNGILSLADELGDDGSACRRRSPSLVFARRTLIPTGTVFLGQVNIMRFALTATTCCASRHVMESTHTKTTRSYPLPGQWSRALLEVLHQRLGVRREREFIANERGHALLVLEAKLVLA